MQLLHGDCLELMQTIPDKSVDLVLTDPPYNIGKAKWDKIPDYINWCGRWIAECQRVLKDNGSFYFWHNDMVQIAQLMEWIRLNTRFVFNSFIIWDKGDFRAQSWKNLQPDNGLRSWFSTAEYCLYYVHGGGTHTAWDRTGLEAIQSSQGCYRPIKDYLLGERSKIGLSTDQLIEKTAKYLGRKVSTISHYFSDSQFTIPTREIWEKFLQPVGLEHNAFNREYEDLRREYEDLRREYEDLRREYEDLRYVHNLDKHHNNIWRTRRQNTGKLHPCEKPIPLLKRTINTSSRSGAVVLDLFMGSGTTGVACVQTGRDFIGIERDDRYFQIAKDRIEQEAKQITLF